MRLTARGIGERDQPEAGREKKPAAHLCQQLFLRNADVRTATCRFQHDFAGLGSHRRKEPIANLISRFPLVLARITVSAIPALFRGARVAG
jgi:hypothetical protein